MPEEGPETGLKAGSKLERDLRASGSARVAVSAQADWPSGPGRVEAAGKEEMVITEASLTADNLQEGVGNTTFLVEMVS